MEGTLYPGIIDKKPKYPEYVLMSQRITSFEGWPLHNVTTPQQLAEAGLFYIGLHGCVRCFFCGGGLKNWESGDLPWIEHARYFPECAYVHLCKGEEFVKACQTFEYKCPETETLKIIRESIPEDRMIKDINSVACKIVQAMGYSQPDIEAAVLFIRGKHGDVEIKVFLIMEYMRGAGCEKTVSARHNRLQILTNSDVNPNPVGCVLGQKETTDNTQTHSRSVSDESGNTTRDTEIPQPNTVDRNSKDILSASTISFAFASKEESERRRDADKLLEENRRLRKRTTCKICLESEVCILFRPCGHLVSCARCAEQLTRCAVCRAEIREKVRIYF